MENDDDANVKLFKTSQYDIMAARFANVLYATKSRNDQIFF